VRGGDRGLGAKWRGPRRDAYLCVGRRWEGGEPSGGLGVLGSPGFDGGDDYYADNATLRALLAEPGVVSCAEDSSAED